MVCAAFGVEVYFKSILTNEGINEEYVKKKIGHDLCKLFSHLSEESQVKLKQHFENDANFIQRLETIANGFVTWRYIYECSNQNLHVDLDFLNRLSQASKILAESKIKELENKNP